MNADDAVLAQLDERDRRIIAALQNDGRASWTAIAAQCDASVPTVARRAQQLFADGIVRVGVSPQVNHEGPADAFILRIGCVAGEQILVARRLARRHDIRFMALITGPYDLVVEMIIRKDDALHARIIEDVMTIEGVLRCETDLVLHTYKVTFDWSRHLLNGGEYVHTPTEPHECDPTHFDDTDRAILAALAGDGRASFRAVADTLEVNESTVRRRFEALRSRGCADVVTIVPAAALGFESEIIFMITVAPSNLDSAARELATYQGVRYLGAMLSGSLLMCEVILPSSRDIFSFVTTTLGKLDGVQGWTASMELVTLKRGFMDAPWAPWQDRSPDDQ